MVARIEEHPPPYTLYTFCYYCYFIYIYILLEYIYFFKLCSRLPLFTCLVLMTQYTTIRFLCVGDLIPVLILDVMIVKLNPM